MKKLCKIIGIGLLALSGLVFESCSNDSSEDVTTVVTLEKPANVSVTSFAGGNYISWDSVKDATGYDVYRIENSKTVFLTQTSSSTRNWADIVSSTNVLLGSAVLAALTFGFVSCSSEDDDDEYNIISGSNKNYTVSYTNETSSNVRGYDTTTFKHRGALIQLTFNSDSLDTNGAMAFIWDLESNSGKSVKDPRVFNIAGGRVVKSGTSYKFQPYISVYKNITDIQEVNLGASSGNLSSDSEATEKEILELSTENQFDVTTDSNGAVTVTINAYEETDESENYTGDYKVDFYAGAITKDTLSTSTPAITTNEITYSQMGYKAYDSTATDKTNMLASNNQVPQKSMAVYANVYAGKTLNGSFAFQGDYSEAEEVVE